MDHFQDALDQASLTVEQHLITETHRLLRDKHATVSVAESLTGGLLSKVLTDLPGSSQTFLGGVVCYHPALKIQFCSVLPATIRQHGVASSQVALEMAHGFRARTKSTICLSTTGVAGPANEAYSEDASGTVFIGVSYSNQELVKAFKFRGSRDTVREQSVNAALMQLKSVLESRI
ncbi:MAG: CinA family protein [Candidatus Margulisiibacteriota bacterium]